MSNNEELLSEEEMEALAEGVASGEIATAPELGGNRQNVAQYDFHQPEHILKARLPAMDMINERFCKYYRSSLFSVIQRAVEIQSEEVQLIKYGDYVNSLPLTTSINRIAVEQLRGAMLFNIDASLIYVVVDCFFGGPGSIKNANLEREFTATEKRLIVRILDYALLDLCKSWEPVHDLKFEYVQAENRAQMANFIDVSDVVVLSKFKVVMNDVEAELHMVFPYSMLEPIRPQLTTVVQKTKKESDDNWHHCLKQRVQDANIEINAIFAQKTISLKELLSLKSGDFIPISMKETTVVYGDQTPLFEGKIGMSNQAVAIRLLSWSNS